MRGNRSLKARLLPGDGPLAKVTPIVAFLVVTAVFVVGVLVRGVTGALLLCLLAAAVAVLLSATWRVLSPSQRVGRTLVLAVLVAIAISVL